MLSAFETAKVFFSSHVDKRLPDPKKILFIGLSEIGSNVLAYGAIKTAREMFPGARLYFSTFEENREILEILGVAGAGDVFTIRSGNFGTLFADTVRFFRSVRREKIEAVVDMELFSRYSAILTYLSGAAVRVGFHGYAVGGLYRGDFFTHQVQFNQHKHISENFIALVKAIQADPSDKPLLKENFSACGNEPPRLDAAPSSADRIFEKLRSEKAEISRRDRIVVLNPEVRTRLPLRSWPVQSYRDLAERLLTLPDVFVVVIGLGESNPACDIQHDRYINMTGKTSLRDLVDLFHVSRVMVSHDSGAVHLASLTDMETVVLFGPETPLLYGPLRGRHRIVSRDLFCSPCLSSFNHRTSACRNNQCMKSITAAEVFEIVKGKLDGMPAGEVCAAMLTKTVSGGFLPERG